MNIQGITPNIAAPQDASTSSSSSSSSSNSSTSSSSLQTTFLNLLVTELQNQDPTSPVDPTAMVGQMVSLNQLDQLIAINQTLTGFVPPSTTASGTGSTQSSGASAQIASGAGSTAAATPSSPRLAGSATSGQQQPSYTPTVDPNALMNLYGSVGAPSTN